MTLTIFLLRPYKNSDLFPCRELCFSDVQPLLPRHKNECRSYGALMDVVNLFCYRNAAPNGAVI